MPRTTITLKDGTILREGDRCRALHYRTRRWRVVVIDGIIQGSGVERAIVTSCFKPEWWVASRYQLKPYKKQTPG